MTAYHSADWQSRSVEVADDAIIDVENIIRRSRENRSRPTPLPVFQVVLDASLEVRTSVVYATFVVALVFLPILTMSGVQDGFSPSGNRLYSGDFGVAGGRANRDACLVVCSPDRSRRDDPLSGDISRG